MTVEFGENEGDGELGNRIGYSVRSQDFYPMFRDTIRHKRKCIVGPVMLNRIVVFFPCEVDKDEYYLRIDAVNLALHVIKTFNGKVGDGIKIGIGRCYDNYELIPTSYYETLTALRHLNGPGVMHISDLPSYSQQCYGYPVQKEKLLIAKASKGDMEGCRPLIQDIFAWLTVTYHSQPLKIKNKLIELIILINQNVASEAEDDPGRMLLLEEILAMEDLTELGLWFNKKIESMLFNTNQINSSKISNLTKTAQRYIEENFSNPITLEDVAFRINVSPQYLSRLFKEETGENFIDYLTRIRIKAARKLLEGTEHNVKEICFKTGYGDPNYFSRIFKKATGLTPTEYKEKFSIY
jgi:two-component system response regulator YesN